MPISIHLSVEGDVYPFILPGPGIIPSHIPNPEPTLLFLEGEEIEVWVDVPKDLSLVNIGTWLGPFQPSKHYGDIKFPNGEIEVIQWKSFPQEWIFYHIADVEATNLSGWWHIRLPESGHPIRLSVWEGLPLFLRKPEHRIPYGTLACSVTDEEGQGLDAEDHRILS